MGQTSQNKITNIEVAGFWLLVDDCEYFVSFADYPVFQTATVQAIFAVERTGPRQYHWPSLDADVELDALEHPERFPLVYK